MRASQFCLFLCVSLLVGGGCFFAPTLDKGIFICKTNTDCPSQMSCSLTEGICKSAGNPADGGNQSCTTQGQTRVCYSGPEGTAGIGSCRPGTQICDKGFWSVCQGEIVPAQETCNGKDDDCNGQIDDNCPCQTGSQRSCYPGPQGTMNVGGCRAGTQSCLNNAWGPCQGFTAPQPEICDGLDNDCNGKIDELPSRRCYTGPPPSLGQGNCKAGNQSCVNGQWGPCEGQVLPARSEICGNRQDDDCNGQVDEGCTCTTGQVQTCYAGPPGTEGLGRCRAGRQVCNNAQWGPCTGQVLPAQEDCNGQDDDCNGRIDDNIGTRPCYSGPPGTQGRGICREGSQSCLNGRWSACQNEVTPQPEQCDNIDNNCDGTIDEGCECTPGQTRECYSGPPQTKDVGNCRAGKQVCQGNRQWGACAGEITPKKEDCNNQDDDCDGNIDGFSQRCYTGPAGTEGRGICREGAQSCTGGKWTPCTGEIKPADETCDGKDNDCDGQIDEGLTRACYPGATGCKSDGKGGFTCIGNCKVGVETCVVGTWGNCVGATQPVQEQCNNQDDDCDGKIDDYQEDCYTATDKGCEPDGKGGYRCKGACQTGKRNCQNGQLSICIGQVTVQPESCNGKDDNCDGQIDEGCQCIANTSRACYNGPTGTEGKGICKAGVQTCNQFGQWGPCNGEVLPTTEDCNGQDDDCDGTVDGLTRSCYTGPANTRSKAPCKDGIQTCANGAWGACVGEVKPTTETCNGIDDDCNGKIDDGLTAPKCPKQAGVCAGSVQRCGGAQGWLPCNVADYGSDYEPIETSCDGKDNDCDGTVDGIGACGKCIFSTAAAVFTATPPTSCKAIDHCTDHCLWYKNNLYYCRNTNNKGFTYTTYTGWLTDCNSNTTCQVSTCGGVNYFCDGTRWREGNKPGSNDDFCDGLDNNCDGKIDEDCTCQSPCTSAQYCKAPCTKCVAQAGGLPICVP